MYLSTGTLTAVESFLTVSAGSDVSQLHYYVHSFVCGMWYHMSVLKAFLLLFLRQGGCIHDGTWQSAVYGFADGHKLQSLRRKFNHKPLPTAGSKLKRRYVQL